MNADRSNSDFLCIHGRNGAVFFFSAATIADWRQSLEFYRAVSFAAKVKKAALLLLYPVMRRKAVLSGEDVQREIGEKLKISGVPEITEHVSAMISPTGDKAIIHEHGVYYHKLAAGKSLEGVRQELKVYQLFQKNPPEHFAVSSAELIKDDASWIHFVMKYAQGKFSEKIPDPESLIVPLFEFFSSPGNRKILWKEQWNTLTAQCPEISKRIPETDLQGETPVGLVHRDFKPWNVKEGQKPLFFDFEAATFDGCPLEDWFNYGTDPAIRVLPIEMTAELLRTKLNAGAVQILKQLELPETELPRYRRWYLLERYVFWKRQGQTELAEKFMKLYECFR